MVAGGWMLDGAASDGHWGRNISRYGLTASERDRMATPDTPVRATESSRNSQKLLLHASTNVTCPQCKNTFGLQEGFARAALEQFEQGTEGALEAVRKAERAEADKRAQQLAAQQA